MHLKRFSIFAAKVIIAHVVTYFIVGALAYQFLTKPLYEGAHAVLATFMRTPAEQAIWGHVMKWFIPGQILRGLLIALALYPFFDTLKSWRWSKRFWVISALYLILGFWASAVAAPGTIDGLIYLRPEITGAIHLIVQPEIIFQGLAMAGWVGWWMARERNRT